MNELEAKFLTTSGKPPEDTLRRLQESLAWAGFRIRPEGRRSFTDRYFDTADLQLRAAGWSYRERQDQQGRRIALKEVTRARAAVFDREEVEQPVGGEENLHRPGPGPVRDRLSNLLHPDARIAPLFTVESRRAAYSLSHPDHPRGLVEMAFDDATIRAKDDLGFKELALELKTGPHELLASILAAVELEPALIDARLSKYERGLIAAGCPLQRRRALQPGVFRRQSSWLDLAVSQLNAQLYQIKLYEPYAWEGVHGEGVHQMRVAARGARAGLRAFADVLPVAEANRLVPSLRWLARVLGAVRDLDVHLARVETYRKRLEPEDQVILDQYKAHLAARHDAGRRDLIEALAQPMYHALISDYRAMLTTAVTSRGATHLRVSDLARQTIMPLLERVYRRGRYLDDDSPDKHLHRLRMDVKRLRYQLEFLQKAYGGELDPALNALEDLQERLGAHQDASVARAHLAHYRKRHATDDRVRRLFKELMSFEKKRARRHRRRFAGDWDRFEAATDRLPDLL